MERQNPLFTAFVYASALLLRVPSSAPASCASPPREAPGRSGVVEPSAR